MDQLTTTAAASPGLVAAHDNQLADVFAAFGSAPTAGLQELTRQFLKIDIFAEGEEKDFIYEGETTVTDGDSERKAVFLRAKDGTAYISSTTVLVNGLTKIKAPAPVRLVYLGKKGVGTTQYHDFKIYTLGEYLAGVK